MEDHDLEHHTLDDHALASLLARSAGELLLVMRSAGPLEGKALGAAGDAMANEYLRHALGQERPDDAVLSEESTDDQERTRSSRVWIVDPLDGTREYSEDRPDWAVHVALAVDGVAVVGAVAQPGLGRLHATPDAVLGPAPAGPMRILVSRTRPPGVAEAVAAATGAELVGMGSAGAKCMAVLRGEAHAYLHAGGQYEWDSAAPVAVARAAGLHASRLDGSALRYNGADPYLPDLVVCRPELAEGLLDAIAAVPPT